MAVLGARHWYRYNSADGKSYRIRTLDYLAEAVGMELDDSSPQLPRGYTPSYIWVKEVEPSRPGNPIRKKLILPNGYEERFHCGRIVEVAGIKMVAQGYSGECWRGMGRNNPPITQVRVEFENEK